MEDHFYTKCPSSIFIDILSSVTDTAEKVITQINNISEGKAKQNKEKGGLKLCLFFQQYFYSGKSMVWFILSNIYNFVIVFEPVLFVLYD